MVSSTYLRAAGLPGSIHVWDPYFTIQSGCVRVTCEAAALPAKIGSIARNGLNHACS
jgi:hypothetical protein